MCLACAASMLLFWRWICGHMSCIHAVVAGATTPILAHSWGTTAGQIKWKVATKCMLGSMQRPYTINTQFKIPCMEA